MLFFLKWISWRVSDPSMSPNGFYHQETAGSHWWNKMRRWNFSGSTRIHWHVDGSFCFSKCLYTSSALISEHAVVTQLWVIIKSDVMRFFAGGGKMWVSIIEPQTKHVHCISCENSDTNIINQLVALNQCPLFLSSSCILTSVMLSHKV